VCRACRCALSHCHIRPRHGSPPRSQHRTHRSTKAQSGGQRQTLDSDTQHCQHTARAVRLGWLAAAGCVRRWQSNNRHAHTQTQTHAHTLQTRRQCACRRHHQVTQLAATCRSGRALHRTTETTGCVVWQCPAHASAVHPPSKKPVVRVCCGGSKKPGAPWGARTQPAWRWRRTPNTRCLARQPALQTSTALRPRSSAEGRAATPLQTPYTKQPQRTAPRAILQAAGASTR
jgi:hypothetical protein